MTSLILKCDNETIGVVRNPYERIVSLYIQSLDYIGMDAWVDKSTPELQTVLYKDCDHIVRFEAWKEELIFSNLHPKDTSILQDETVQPMWERWYTLRSRQHIYELYREDIKVYGYSY